MTEGQRTPEGTWDDVGRQFQALGESLARTFRAAWENEENRESLQEMKMGLESIATSIGQAIDSTAASPEGQKVQREVEKAAESARLAGMNISALTLIIMLLSGGVSALGGTVEIVGDFFRMEKNVTGGYGFTAIVVVMLARRNIVALPFVSIFISGVLVGATSLTLVGIPATFAQVFVGLLLLCVVFATWLERRITAETSRLSM